MNYINTDYINTDYINTDYINTDYINTDYINTNIPGLKYGYLTDNTGDNIITNLYSLLIDADEYVDEKTNGKCFQYNLTKIHMVSQIPRPKVMDSHFFPKKIRTYVDDNAAYNVQFTCTIKGRLINIYFVLTNEIKPGEYDTLEKYVYMMYMWFHMLNDFSSKKCSKTVSIFIYFTPFEKQLPDNQLHVIDTEHVNSAYTTGCKEHTEIVLYRKEEWFKVFIHETFHNFGLDFSNMSMYSINQKLKTIFNVNIEFNLYESYCEFWGRTINTLMYSYQSIRNTHASSSPTKMSKMLSKFKNIFKRDMETESKHSLVQAMKILDFLDLKYNHIVEKKEEHVSICNYLYKENTSAFSYYIITSLLMNNYNHFIDWCSKHNNLLLQFKKTPGNVDAYLTFIGECCKNKKIIKNISTIEKYFSKSDDTIVKTLKMSINDVNKIFTK
jgi:hypothetical protein